jgi:predicted O-methyltransferase YrrM
MIEAIFQPGIEDYLESVSVRENSYAQALRQHTLAHVDQVQMMSTPVQAQFLAFLITLLGAKRVIEVGVYTGYATLQMAQALPDDGIIMACDKNARWPNEGRPFWQQAGVAEKIQLQLAPALETLQLLLDEGHGSSFDMIFVDADKIHYPQYYVLALQLVRSGGLMVFDNALWVGRLVAEQSNPATKAVHQLNHLVSKDDRVNSTLLSVGAGMLLIQRR